MSKRIKNRPNIFARQIASENAAYERVIEGGTLHRSGEELIPSISVF